MAALSGADGSLQYAEFDRRPEKKAKPVSAGLCRTFLLFFGEKTSSRGAALNAELNRRKREEKEINDAFRDLV